MKEMKKMNDDVDKMVEETIGLPKRPLPSLESALKDVF